MRLYMAVIFFFIFIFSSYYSFAGTLSVNVPRIVISDKTRTGEFKVYNTYDEVQSFRISLIDKQMDSEGNIKTVASSPTSAAKLLRVGPRMGKSIAPKDFQKFRLRAKTSKLTDGEYRSHLLIEPMTPPKEKTTPGVHVRPNIKYSIPIIVRHGDLQASVKIENISFNKIDATNATIQFELHRVGNRSLYGDIEIRVVNNTKEELIKSIKGQAIYTDITSRQFKIDLASRSLKSKQLKIVFKENPEFGGNSQTQALINI